MIGTGGATTLHGTGYAFRVTADSARTEYKQGRLNASRIRVNGNWDNGLLRMDRAAVNLPGLTATGNRLAYPTNPDSLLAGNIRLAGTPREVLDFIRTTISPWLPPVSGGIDLNVVLGGTPRAPRIGVVLSSPALQVKDVMLRESFLRGFWMNPATGVDSLSLVALGGSFHGHGMMNTRTLFAENTVLIFRGIDVKRLAQLVSGLSAYSGKASGTISAGGIINNPDSLEARVRLTIENAAYLARRIPDIVADATLRNGKARAGLTSGDARVTADALIRGNRLKGNFNATVPQISVFTGLAGITDLTGVIAGQGTVGGFFSSPEVRTTLTGHSIMYKSFPVDSLAGDIIWRKKALSFSNLRVSGNLASIADLRPPLHVDSLSGAMHYIGVIDGDLASSRAEASLVLEKPAYRNFRFDTGLVNATVRGDMLDISEAVLENDSLRVGVTGTLDYKTLKGSASIELGDKVVGPAPAHAPGAKVSAVFDLKNREAISASLLGEGFSLPFLARLAPAPPPVEGMLSFTGTIGGNMKDPEARVVFNILKPGFRTTYLDSLRGEVSLLNGQALLQPLEIFRENFHAALNASLTLEKTPSFYTVTRNSPVQGTLKGDSLQFGFVQDLLPPAIGKIAGTAQFDLGFDGALSNPHPRGTASLAGFSIDPSGGGPFFTGVDILAEARGDSLILSARNGQLLQKPFSIEARVNYNPPGFGGNVDFFFDGQKALNVSGVYAGESMEATTRVENLDLAILRAFVPVLKTVSGTMNSNLVFTGTLANPKPNGALRIHGLNLDLPNLDMPLRNGIVNLKITPNRVDMDTLFVKVRKGSIRAAGYLDDVFAKTVKGELQTTIDNVQIKKKNLFDATVRSARLSLTGDGDSYLIAGNASMGETSILYPISIQSLLERLTGPPAPPPPPPPAYMKKIRMDIVVDGGEHVNVKNSMADIRTRADIEVIGTLAAPNILGSATVVEGNVQYLDRKFTITEGSVQFTNRMELNPLLNIQAETTVSTYSMFGSEPYKVTLIVSGASKAPTVKLTSDPTLAQPDIISLLTLGVTRGQVGMGSAAGDTTTSLQNVLKQRAEILTSQRLAGYLGQEFGGLLGLQSLTVEGNLFNINGEEGGPRIIASKQISPNVEVTSITTIGRQSDQGIQVNYTVTGNFTLRGQTDSQGRSGLDVLYRLRFR